MKIFGGILPFVGWRTEEVDADLRRFFDYGQDVTHVNTFQLEWFGYGLIFCLGPVEPGE